MFLILFLIVTFITTTLAVDGEAFDMKISSKIIQDYVSSYARAEGSEPLCDQYNCCDQTTSGEAGCPLSNMKKDETTLVLPGGETRCIFDTSTPYAFQVIPGDTDKVLLYFQGGGACWDKLSTELGFCSTDVVPQGPQGVFDRTANNNKFKDFTIVQALYCSGDVYGGNKTQDYNMERKGSVVQHGIQNAQATLDWILHQQQNGQLASTLTELVVMGCSAGSIGAQIWSDRILNTLSYKVAAVIPDSYAGVFPPNVLGPLVYEFNFCQAGFLSDYLTSVCLNQTLTIEEINIEYMKKHPIVPYGFVQSKIDIVQQSFYIALGITTHTQPELTNPTQFYTDLNVIFGNYNQLPNFVTYLVDGWQHCFTNHDLYYTADPLGKNDKGENASPLLSDWVNIFPLSSSPDAKQTSTVSTQCRGEVDYEKFKFETPNATNSYCSPSVYPKTFTV